MFLFGFVGQAQVVLNSDSGVINVSSRISLGTEPVGDPVATITSPTNTASESPLTNGGFSICIDRAAPAGGTIVNYTWYGTATGGSDYVNLTGVVTILEGQTCATITVVPIDDGLVEVGETVIAQLDTTPGIVIGDPNIATVTILSEDSSGGSILASVLADTPTVNEGSSTTWTISLSEPNNSGSDITVSYHDNGHAQPITDYTALSGSVVFGSGEQHKTVTLNTNSDTDIEPYKSVLLTLDEGTGYELEGLHKAAIFIVDDDDENQPSVSGTSTITSLADFTNSSNAGTTATVTGTFDATGATAASGMVLVAGGGVISGTNINLNGSGIQNGTSQIFAASARFNQVYELSRVSINVFGATSGDATDDNAAIDAAIINCSHITSTLDGTYIKNDNTDYTRTGMIDWDMNNAKVSVTNTSNFNTTSTNTSYVFDFTNLNPYIYNGEMDGTDTYGRFIYIHEQQYYLFKDLHIHSLYAVTTYRAAAIRGTFQIDDDVWDYGEIEGCLIEDIIAEGDGNYNNSPAGVSKGFYFTMQGGHLATTDYDAVFRNNIVRRIKGDDAEAFYVIHQGGGTYTHKGEWFFDNEDYRHNTRRAMKVNISNVTVQNSHFEEVLEADYVSAQQMGSMVDIFSISSSFDLEHIYFVNNTAKGVDGEPVRYHLFSLTETVDAIVKDNDFSMSNVENYAAIRLGSGTSTYTGDLIGTKIYNNNFTNAGIQMLTYYNPTGQTEIYDNIFTYNWSASDFGNHQAVIRTTNTTGTKGSINFHDNIVNINSTVSSSLFHGLIYSAGAPITNMDFTDNTLNIPTLNLTNSVGWLIGDFGNTNSITNLTVTGDASPTLNIDGSGGVVRSGNSPTITLN